MMITRPYHDVMRTFTAPPLPSDLRGEDRAVECRTEPYLDLLAHLVAEHGIEQFGGDVARLVVRLRATGITGPLVGLLADRTAPAVARERALGHLLCRLADASAGATPDRSEPAA